MALQPQRGAPTTTRQQLSLQRFNMMLQRSNLARHPPRPARSGQSPGQPRAANRGNGKNRQVKLPGESPMQLRGDFLADLDHQRMGQIDTEGHRAEASCLFDLPWSVRLQPQPAAIRRSRFQPANFVRALRAKLSKPRILTVRSSWLCEQPQPYRVWNRIIMQTPNPSRQLETHSMLA